MPGVYFFRIDNDALGKEKIKDSFYLPHDLRMDDGDEKFMVKGGYQSRFIIETEYASKQPIYRVESVLETN